MAAAYAANPFASVEAPHPDASWQPMPSMPGTYGNAPVAPSFHNTMGPRLEPIMPINTHIPMPYKSHMEHGMTEMQQHFLPNQPVAISPPQTVMAMPPSPFSPAFQPPSSQHLERGHVELRQSFVPGATPPMPHPQFHSAPAPSSATHHVPVLPFDSMPTYSSPRSPGRPTQGAWSITEALNLGEGDVCENPGEVIVRCEEWLDSAPVATLPPRSQIIIKMISGRRALISSGKVIGWVSTRSAEGIPLVQRIENSGKAPISPWAPARTAGEPNLVSEIQGVILPEKLKHVPSGFGMQRCEYQPARRPKISHEQLPTGVDTTVEEGDVVTNYHEMIVTETEDVNSKVLRKIPPNCTLAIEEVSGKRARMRMGGYEEGWINLRGQDGSLNVMNTSPKKAAIPVNDRWCSADAPSYSGSAAPPQPLPFQTSVPAAEEIAGDWHGHFSPEYQHMEAAPQPELGEHKVAKGHYRSDFGLLPSWGPEFLPVRKIGEPGPDPHLWEPFPTVGPEHAIPSEWVNYRRYLETTSDEWEKRALWEPTIYRDYTTFRATTRSLMLKRHQFDLPPEGSAELAEESEEARVAEEARERLAAAGLDQGPERGPFGKQYTQHGKLFMTLSDPRNPDPDQFRVGKKQQVETYAGTLMAPKNKGDDQDACTFA